MKKNHSIIIVLLIIAAFVSVESVNSSVQQRPNIKIGVLVPDIIFPGIESIKGIELAVEEINVDGIIVGGTVYNFEIFLETTSGITGLPDVATASASLAKLQDQHDVLAILGGYNPEVLAQIQGELVGTPFLGIGSTAPIFSNYLFRVGPTNGSRLAYALAEFYGVVMNDLGVKNITIVRQDSTWTPGLGAGIKAIIAGAYASMGLINNFTFNDDLVIPESATFSSVESALSGISSETNALLTLFSEQVGGFVTEAWTKLDMDQWLAGINVESQARDFFQQSDGAAYGEIGLEAVARDISSTVKTDPFKQAFYDKHKKIPSLLSFFGYDATYILKDAIERAVTTTNGNLIHTALVDTDYVGAAHRYKFTTEPNQTETPNGIPTTVHDLFTPMSYGIHGGEYANPVMVQWQKNGEKVTIWGIKSFTEDVTDLKDGLPKLIKAPIDHSDFGIISTSPITTSSSIKSSSSSSSSSESILISSNPTITTNPGFSFYALLVLTFISVPSWIIKKRR
jgi:branched-chain amino acid transport system substrate-binding protein